MNIRIIALLVVLTLGTTGYALAHCGTCGIGDAAKTEADNHMMENKICLCGMKLDEGKTVHVQYEGKTYHFCSQDCADAFQKDPAASLEKMAAIAAAAETAPAPAAEAAPAVEAAPVADAAPAVEAAPAAAETK